MRFFKKYFTVLFILTAFSARSQNFLHAYDKKIVNGKNQEVLLRGIGLGGWMLQEPYMLQINGIANTQHEFRTKIEALIGAEATKKFYDSWLSNQITKADIDSLAAWGFNSVRLPMHYNLFTLSVDQEKDLSTNTWLDKGFRLVDSLLSWCKQDHIYLILDLHAAPGGQGNDIAISDRDSNKPSLWQSRANQQKTIALWKKLAQRYAHETWIGGYDLLNETNWGFQEEADKNGCNEKLNTALRSLLIEITAAIREVDKNHLIFIEGNCWANNYSGIFPLWDKNIAVSFHKYWNNNDKESIKKFLLIREEQDAPLWMGESGENSNAWFTDAISLLEQNHIGWSWWPLKKLGSNNPLQVKADNNYWKLLDYFRGKNQDLSATEATRILQDFAEAQRTKNNLVHHDIIDAMFRQVKSEETLPFKKLVLADRAVLYASDYDFGRSGLAYHDVDSGNYWVSSKVRTNWNSGGQYRNDGVDIGVCNDTLTNGFSIGWTKPGEWLQYTVTVPESGVYDLNVRNKTGTTEGRLSIFAGDRMIISNMSIPVNSQWQNTTVKNIFLQKGINRLRLQVVEGGFDLNYVQFSRQQKTNQVTAKNSE
jgi:aryl-phospho-beta-D-glucosidase BglC (GH1 family)